MTSTRSLAELLDRFGNEGRLLERIWSFDPAGMELTGIADDSRAVQPGSLFVAVKGLRVDGHAFVRQAIERGAVAVVVEVPVDGLPVPQLVVDRGAASLASAAAWWYGDPSRELLTVGVTGTNGKTTTSFLAAAGLTGAGFATGLIGTVGIRIGGRLSRNEEPNTTPGALNLQRILREMVDAGEQAVVIETSSTGSRRIAWRAWTTTPRSSRTSRTSTWTSTARSMPTSGPSAACSSGCRIAGRRPGQGSA